MRLWIGVVVVVFICIYFNIFRYKLLDEYGDVQVYKDRYLGELDIYFGSDDYANETFYTVTYKNVPILHVFQKAHDHNLSLYLDNQDEDSINVFIYGTGSYFRIPINQGLISIKDAVFINDHSLPFDHEWYSSRLLKDYDPRLFK